MINNVYLPFRDTRLSVDENINNMLEAVGHLEAAHDLTTETIDYITLGDLNCDPSDRCERFSILNNFFSRHGI